MGPASAPSLVTWPTSSTAIRSRLRDLAHDPRRDLADLRDRTGGRSAARADVQRLHRVDHAHLRALGARASRAPRRRSVSAITGMRERLAGRPDAARAAGSAPRTPRPRRTACADRRRTGSRAPSSSSVDLPIPGAPPISTTDPGTTPPPSTRVELADARAQAFVIDRLHLTQRDRRERCRAARAPPAAGPAPRGAAPGGRGLRSALLDKRVPLGTVGTAAGPARGLVTTLGADEHGVGSRHRVHPTPRSRRHRCPTCRPSRS